MSFLTPVNEPVLRFKSTDTGAPQLNQASRTAGDVKAILKACLVTGYGAIASAGWSIINEVGNVAEFTSPSPSMLDYKLGISDNSTANTTWYYKYKNTKINPTKNAIKKSFSDADVAQSNGWQLLVTKRGLYFIEVIHSSAINDKIARVTYWGLVKSTALADLGQAFGFWCAGYDAPTPSIHDSFRTGQTDSRYFNVNGNTDVWTASAVLDMFSTVNNALHTNSSVDMSDGLYLTVSQKIAGQQPALLLKTTNNLNNLFGVRDDVVSGRPVLYLSLSLAHSSYDAVRDYARNMTIYLDYWGY